MGGNKETQINYYLSIPQILKYPGSCRLPVPFQSPCWFAVLHADLLMVEREDARDGASPSWWTRSPHSSCLKTQSFDHIPCTILYHFMYHKFLISATNSPILKAIELPTEWSEHDL